MEKTVIECKSVAKCVIKLVMFIAPLNLGLRRSQTLSLSGNDDEFMNFIHSPSYLN